MWIIAKLWTYLINLSQVSIHNLKQAPNIISKNEITHISQNDQNIECNSVRWVNLQISD
jgi:hypothetical protein